MSQNKDQNISIIIVNYNNAKYLKKSLNSALNQSYNFKEIIVVDDISNDNSIEILKKYKKKIHTIFHFGEFARIYQSFIKMNECINSNTIGTHEVFRFCMDNKIKLIYFHLKFL